jgi:hypothetical protein
MMKIFVSIILLMFFNSCISIYKNGNGNERPRNPKFRISKKINDNNTGLEGIFREQEQIGNYFRFFKDGHVFVSNFHDYNQINKGYIGFYTLQNNIINIEILYATQGYSYWTLKGTFIDDKIKFYKVSKKNPKRFDRTYKRIDVNLEPLKPDW